MLVTPKTLRAARLAELGNRAGLRRRTVMRIERGGLSYINESFDAIKRALEDAGVVFVTWMAGKASLFRRIEWKIYTP